MYRPSEHPANPRPQATGIATEWARTFFTQTVIGILLAVIWATLGLQ